MTRESRAAVLVVMALAMVSAAPQERLWREGFSQGDWTAAPAAGVQLATTIERDASGPALRLDFDFQGRGGWAAARRELDVALPENWELRFRIRGTAPPNHLEIKFIDPSGENVWWSVRRDFAVPSDWTAIRIKKRHVTFAWGPAAGVTLTRVRALEFAITAGTGGRGSVWLSDLELRALPPERPYTGTPHAGASVESAGGEASLALDGRRDTAWRTARAPAELTIDFRQTRIFGGVTLHWTPGHAPRRFAVDLQEAGEGWREARRIERGGGFRTDVLLPDAEAAALRVRIMDAPSGAALSEVVVRPLEFGASPNAFFEAIAKESPRGAYPRGFSGEQVFWAIAGVDGDIEEALVSEDAAVEAGAGAPALEPFFWIDGRLSGWGDFSTTPALVDGDLPIPVLSWEPGGIHVELTALAAGEPGRSTLLARYLITNKSASPRAGRFFLAARPFQVNPPSQFLNRTGGVAPIRSLRCHPQALEINGRTVAVAPAPAACGVAAFDEVPVTEWLAQGGVPTSQSVDDPFPYASGALAWDFNLRPGESRGIVVAAPFHDAAAAMAAAVAGADPSTAAALFDEHLARERKRWRETLDRVRIELPAEAAHIAAVVRSSLGWVLVNRDGPAIQPGSRAYERSWIRDGTLTSTALLRLGHAETSRAFAEWFAGFQYPDGRIPCCVDRSGAGAVPEHDSHGQFIHLVTEVTRFTGDRAFATGMFPHVPRAAAAIDDLRRQRRTAEYRADDKAAFFGLMPESISHEGYSAKPVHSYWDAGFAWRGLADARWLAGWLGDRQRTAQYAASLDELGGDLRTSIERVRARHGVDYIPGSADLGDFDSTSTTVMLDPVGLDALLPRQPFVATFERYDREVRARIAGEREWDAYTPYEVRHIGTYVRLGWRERAHDLLRAFLADRRPPGWNQFPEVTTREVRKPRFLGDLPHGWVASDFIRSALDLFAYERRTDGALVLAAGIPQTWLAAGGRVAISGLRTPWGALSFDIAAKEDATVVRIDRLERWPAGGVILALPLPAGARGVSIDGRDVRRGADGSVAVPRLPAVVVLKPGR